MQKIVNDVPAEGQMKNSPVVSFFGSADAPLKILIVGNSITRHAPKEEIHWFTDCGMAASCPEKDFVHRLYAKLTESGKDVYMYVRQASHWERNYKSPDCLEQYADEKAFEADIVVFRLGENVLKEDVPYFKDAIREYLDFLCPKGGRIILTTSFWKYEPRDSIIRELGEELSCPVADIGCTSDDMMAIGLFPTPGVAAHPGDKGMEMIAQRIFELI